MDVLLAIIDKGRRQSSKRNMSDPLFLRSGWRDRLAVRPDIVT